MLAFGGQNSAPPRTTGYPLSSSGVSVLKLVTRCLVGMGVPTASHGGQSHFQDLVLSCLRIAGMELRLAGWCMRLSDLLSFLINPLLKTDGLRLRWWRGATQL